MSVNIFDFESDKNKLFSLHDCRSNHIELNHNQLIIYFPDGIYCADYNDDWPNTGSACVEYNIDCITIYLFINENDKTIRKECSIDELIYNVNNKIWQLEFLYRYEGYQEIIHTCYIWQNKIPWSIETQLLICIKDKELYRYNKKTL